MGMVFAWLFPVFALLFFSSLFKPQTLFKGKLQTKSARWLFGLLTFFSLLSINVNVDQKNVQDNSVISPAQEINQLSSQAQIQTQKSVDAAIQSPSSSVDIKEEKKVEEVKPVYTTPAACGTDYYRNVDGDCVHRPSTSSSGATAQCRDGSYSYSQNRRGTCSHHGGVAQWL